jgi:hypothetical protein
VEAKGNTGQRALAAPGKVKGAPKAPAGCEVRPGAIRCAVRDGLKTTCGLD